ncbi:MAG: hypothetical protein PHG67_09780 [Bacteroidales bacterium]|jgi:hypothetical protein|nr:hypothetical protein [Bacteroidales bacterium]
MTQTFHIVHTGDQYLVNGKTVKAFQLNIPDNGLNQPEKEALKRFVDRKPKVQSSIYTL